MTDKRVAVVTGANRGLGYETSKQLANDGYRVVMACRDQAKGQEAEQKLKDEGLDVTFHQLDVTDEASIGALVDYLKNEEGRVDVLVNNAGSILDVRDPEKASVFTVDMDTMREAFEINVFGATVLSQRIIPIMREAGFGRVVNVSSGMGQLDDMGGGVPSYRMTKTALNALTRMLSAEVHDDKVLINSVCPGWVKTDLGGPSARLEVEEGVKTIVWLAELPDDGPRGGFFREKQPIPW